MWRPAHCGAVWVPLLVLSVCTAGLRLAGGDSLANQEAACNALLTGAAFTKSSAAVDLSKCSKLQGTIYLDAIFSGAGVNQTSFTEYQSTFESMLSEGIQDGLDATAAVLNTHSQGGNTVEANIALSPIQFKDLQLWADALFSESLASNLADDMTSLGVPIDSITYTAKFAFGLGSNTTSVGIFPLQPLMTPSGSGLQIANYSALCDLAPKLSNISIFPWPCQSLTDDLQSAAVVINCNALLNDGKDVAADCGGVSGSVQVTVLLQGDNYPLTTFDQQSLDNFMAAELPKELPQVSVDVLSTQRDPQNTTSTLAVVQFAPVDYSQYEDFVSALSASSYASNLWVDLLSTGITAQDVSMGESTFRYGTTSVPSPLPNADTATAPRASQEDQSAATNLLLERLQPALVTFSNLDTEGYTSFQKAPAFTSFLDRDTFRSLLIGPEDLVWRQPLSNPAEGIVIDLEDDSAATEFRQQFDDLYKKKADASKADKAVKDAADNIGKAAAVAVKAVAKYVDNKADPRAVETLTSSIVGGIAGLVATVYGGPLAGAAAEVAASAIVTFLFDYHPPYKVQDLSTGAITLTDEQKRLFKVVSDKQANEALYTIMGYTSSGQIVQNRPLFETQLLAHAQRYTDSVESCKRNPPPKDCAQNALTCQQFRMYQIKLLNPPGELYLNGTLASYVSYQALNLVALQTDAVSFNTTCPAETRSLSQQFASFRLFQDSVRTAIWEALYLAQASVDARRSLLVYSTAADFQPYKGNDPTVPSDDRQGFPQEALDKFKAGNLDPTLFKYLPTGCAVRNSPYWGRQFLQVLSNDRMERSTFTADPFLSRVITTPVYGRYKADGMYSGVWADRDDLTKFDSIPSRCKPSAFLINFLWTSQMLDSWIADLDKDCKAAIKKEWSYTCSYCSGAESPPWGPDINGNKPESSGVQTNGKLVSVKWVDYYTGKQRQYVECHPPTQPAKSFQAFGRTADDRRMELQTQFQEEASQALIDLEVSTDAALSTLQAWPADPGQINPFFYYRFPSQVPIFTESSYQGSVGQPLENYYIPPDSLLATQNDTGPMSTSNITSLSIVVDSVSTLGIATLRSLSVTYGTQKTFLIGGYNGSWVTPFDVKPPGNTALTGRYVAQYNINIASGDYINNTVITYGAVPELSNATVINAIKFTTMSGAAYNFGSPDSRLFQTGFPGMLKGFKGYGTNTIAALGIYAITEY